MSSLNYDVARPVYFNGNRFTEQQFTDAIAAAYSASDRVLVYINGRAVNVGEPKKSVQQKIYEELAGYGVAPIGFTWDAIEAGYKPQNAYKSAPVFVAFMNALSSFLSKNPGKIRPSLLAHSMGNLIISKLASEGAMKSPAIFENIILTAAAVEAEKHHEWLKKISNGDRIYIIVNPDDQVLRLAGIAFRPDMLGKVFERPGVSKGNIFYVDIERTDVNHRYFVPQGQSGSPILKVLYQELVTGGIPDLGKIARQKTVDGILTYRIK